MGYTNYFIERIGHNRCFTNLLQWMNKQILFYQEEWEDVQKRMPDKKYIDLEECYFEKVTECYQLLLSKKGKFSIDYYRIKFSDGSIYNYRPLKPIVFNGLLYAISCFEDATYINGTIAKTLLRFLDEWNQTAANELFDLIHHYYQHEIPMGRLPESCKVTKRKITIIPAEPSNCFSSKLKRNQKLFVDYLQKVEPTIGKRNGRTWGHVMEAFKQMHFIDEQCVRAEFARAIAELCPNLKAKNVEQALKRFYEPISKDRTKEANIIADIAKQFQPVLDAIKP